jgi:ribosome-binding protein aMBF1 (putative translation factor)
MAEILMRWKAPFWSRVEVGEDDECWNWAGAVARSGYGAARLDGKNVTSNRVAYIMEHGEIPPGLFVCHSCDNRLCCNPGHLFAGTHEDNVRDMCSKKRQPQTGRSTPSPLDEDKVRAIREEYAKGGIKQSELAERYGVSAGTIGHITQGNAWKWVQ